VTPEEFLAAQARFARVCRFRLVLLACVLAGLWLLSRRATLTPDEAALRDRVRSAEAALSIMRSAENAADPRRLGVIGVEWSPISTTIGNPAAKRTAADPLWSVVLLREMRRMGLRSGDRVAILASGSFPGFVLNALMAAESLGCHVLFAASLGASQWGANDPACPWPLMEMFFRRSRFIRTPASWYTLGGDGETGGGIGDEGRIILMRAAAAAGVPVIAEGGYGEVLAEKIRRLEAFSPRLLITIGGSSTFFGAGNEHAGNGFLESGVPVRDGSVVGWAMSRRIPVFHAIDFRSLSERFGVPFDGASSGPAVMRAAPAIAGLAVFFAALATHARWRIDRR
jgi:poly-gamma-glutamate system protein